MGHRVDGSRHSSACLTSIYCQLMYVCMYGWRRLQQQQQQPAAASAFQSADVFSLFFPLVVVSNWVAAFLHLLPLPNVFTSESKVKGGSNLVGAVSRGVFWMNDWV